MRQPIRAKMHVRTSHHSVIHFAGVLCCEHRQASLSCRNPEALEFELHGYVLWASYHPACRTRRRRRYTIEFPCDESQTIELCGLRLPFIDVAPYFVSERSVPITTTL